MPRLAYLLALLPISASAVPMEYPHQGRLLDAEGQPINGTHDLTVALYEGAMQSWVDTFSDVPVENGFYTVMLGSGEALDAGDLAGSPSVEIRVDGQALANRTPLASVPYAVLSTTAENVDGGLVNASAIQIDGTTVINSDGHITAAALDGASVPRVFRYQGATGSKSCGAALPSFTFQGEAGEQATLWFAWAGRPNSNGHTYVTLRLNGSVIASDGEWSTSTWRRTFTTMVNVTLSASGTQTITASHDCGNGTSSFRDTGGEWPLGGLSYTVMVGG